MDADVPEIEGLPVRHTVREHATATSDPMRPFAAGGGSALPSDLIEQLLAAADDGDDYDPRLAYALAVVAGWSYSDAETMRNKLKYYALPHVTVDKAMVTNPAMFIVASAFLVRSRCGRFGVLAFRGTEPTNAISWLTDTDVFLRPFRGGSVHQGFYTNLQAVWEEVVALLGAATTAGADGRAPLAQLYVTGHSLGGAMAVLAAARLSIDRNLDLARLVRGVYTFGQPAVGNKDFADEFEERIGARLFRHSYAYDVVPQLPPAWSDRFVHFGTELVTTGTPPRWVKARRKRSQAPWIVPAVASCATSFVTRRLPILEYAPLPYSLDDHSPSRYIEASRQALA